MAAERWRFIRFLASSVISIGLLLAIAILVGSGVVHDISVGAVGTILASWSPIRERWRRWRLAVGQAKSISYWTSSVSSQDNELRAGPLTVPDVQLVAICTQAASYEEHIQVRFDKRFGDARPDPPEWAIMSTVWLPQLRARAKVSNQPLRDGAQVDMIDASIDRHPERPRGEPTTFHIRLARTGYFKFAAMSNSLDVPVAQLGRVEGEPGTLRRRWDAYRQAGFWDAKDFPAPVKVGTATVVVAKDDLMALHVRSSLVQNVPGQRPGGTTPRPSLFMGEGMLPRDRDESGMPSPASTVRRALYEELGLGDREILGTDITATGIIFDRRRWQPVFCYLAQLPVTFDELCHRAMGAKDRWEGQPVPYVFDCADKATCQLLLGLDRQHQIGSNHSQAALLFSLIYRYGEDAVIRQLESQELALDVLDGVDNPVSSS